MALSLKDTFKKTIDESGGAIGSSIGGLASSIIGGGYNSGVGNTLNTLGDAASVIPGPYGVGISAGLKVLGGVTNALVGTKVDAQALHDAQQGTDYYNTFTSNASSFDDIQGPVAQKAIGTVYKGGLFSSGSARRKQAKLEQQRQNAEQYAYRNVANNVNNLIGTQISNLESNYFDLGGALHTQGSDWEDGFRVINNGGKHESSSLGGVPMGIAEDGQPNLVEEGEAIFNDYVYSNRLKLPKAVRDKYKLRGVKTFADAAKKVQKANKETINDPITKRTVNDLMGRLQEEQETVKQKQALKDATEQAEEELLQQALMEQQAQEQPVDEEQQLEEQQQEQQMEEQPMFAEGGQIEIAPNKKGTFTAAATKHNMGVQAFANKVLSNPNDYSEAMRKKAQFAKNASKWHAYGGLIEHVFSKGGSKSTKNKPNTLRLIDSTSKYKPDLLGKYGYNNVYDNYGQILGKSSKALMPTDTVFRNQLKRMVIPTNTGNNKSATGLNPAYLRYAPALASGVMALTDALGITNTPDYSYANSIVNAGNNIAKVRTSPIDNYLTYKPFDRLFYANKLEGNAAAARRQILNNAGLNRGAAIAGLVAADANTKNQLGDLYRQGEEFNFNNRAKVFDANSKIKMYNADNALKADMFNSEVDKARLGAISQAMQLRQAEDARVGAARSANLSNFIEGLGGIGRESYFMNSIGSNPRILYGSNILGNMKYKSLGGKLNTKKRRK